MLNISQAGGTISFGVNVNPDDRLAPALPESANSQRTTMQAPQGLDAQHRGELFPVNESYAAPQSLSRPELFARDAAKPASRNSGKTRGGQDGGRNFRRCETRPPPQSQTANTQQCRCHKDLMRNTAASCFPSTRVALQPQLPPAGVSASPTREKTRGGQRMADKIASDAGLLTNKAQALYCPQHFPGVFISQRAPLTELQQARL